MQENVTLTIDGRQIRVAPNTLLVEAAAQLGILVPVYCYHPKLAPVGACRMCLVEVEGMPKLIASCTTPVREGMVVHTTNARVEKARSGMLEFLLIHHPLDCPVCDKGGECPLQDFTYEFGPTRSRFRYPKRHWEKPLQVGRNILLDRERCIMCFRCVRFNEEISGHRELGVYRRGNNQMICAQPGKPFNSQFSGNTIELCPVGALTGRPTRFFGRTWEVSHTPGICTGCAAGCNIRIDTRPVSRVVRIWSRENRHTDDGWLCDHGRFGYEFVNENRLEDPKVKSGSSLEDTTWPRAITKAASVLSDYAKQGTLGILASPRLTNEELWGVSKIAREILKTSNLDHTARYEHPDAVRMHTAVRQAGFKPGTLSDLDGAGRIVLIGSDVSVEQPVTDLRIKKALWQRHAQMVIVNDKCVELSQYTDHNLIYGADGAAEAISGLAQAIGGSGGDEAARKAGAVLAGEGQTVVVVGWKLGQSSNAPKIFSALSDLARVLGPDTPCIVILQHCNTRGALDMGVTPAGLPGSDSPVPGLSGEEILKGARDGKIKALWIIENEPLSDADEDLVKAAFEGLEAIVYQGWSMPNLPKIPDVALPTTTFAETAGTFTNTDGRVQRLFAAVPPRGRSRTGLEVVNDLARALGAFFEAATVPEAFEEISRAVPGYHDLRYSRLGTTGIQSGIEKAAAIAGTSG